VCKGLFSPAFPTAFLIVSFLDDCHLTGVRWNHNTVLLCLSFMVKAVESFFMHLLTICTSSFENYLFSSFEHLLVRLFVLLVFNFWSC
jgi:hypothetical protein